MSFNWGQLATNLTGLTSALTAVGVTPANMGTVLNQIGAIANPNQAEELALCQQMMIAAGNPAMIQLLVSKLVTEQGIPADAAAVAMQLLQPGVDVVAKVMQIEQLIKSGG
jgi:hypothetical protein